MMLYFVSTLEKHLQSNQYQDLFFEIRHIRTKYIYFVFRLNFDFGFYKNHDETDCVSEQVGKKEWILIAISEAVCLLNSPLLERSDDLLHTVNNFPLIFLKTLCCGYSIESSRRDNSIEYPQHRVWFKNFRFFVF